ncbi:MAG: hypothetical protein NT075_24955 [Chloroflexi bacterium]|nr:hypothetical protein [Chloroflexota bacterium]
MATSSIVLTEATATSSTKIVQLFEHLELFSEGEPAHHTLFVLGRTSLAQLDALQAAPDQLLLIDPPVDVRQRFTLEGNIAVLFTGTPQEVGLPQMQTVAGGIAHIRIGEHFLDIYTRQQGAVVHLPALGILCGGSFGSDSALPELAANSAGQEEVETLRLLARLLKQSRLQLYIPQIGPVSNSQSEVMMRLAQDVAYLHNLQRVVPALVQRGDALAGVLSLADSLLPAERRSSLCRAIHLKNLQTMVEASQNH